MSPHRKSCGGFVLKALDVPPESQVLVFSKTSLQNPLIEPGNPRALLFSENTYVGYVPGGAIEVIAQDPVLGPIFYVVEAGAKGEPRIERDTNQCMTCHATSRTENVPGLMIRSVFADEDPDIDWFSSSERKKIAAILMRPCPVGTKGEDMVLRILKGWQPIAPGRGARATTTRGSRCFSYRTLKGVPEAPESSPVRRRCDPLPGSDSLPFAFSGWSSRSLLDPELQAAIPAGIMVDNRRSA